MKDKNNEQPMAGQEYGKKRGREPRPKKKRARKILGSGIALAIIAAILLGIGLNGKGGDGDEKNDDSRGNVQEGEGNKESGESSNEIIVTINESKVFVGDKEIENEEALKQYIEEINKDGVSFKLKDENSILDTYEWVSKVFNELKIKLYK